MLRASVAVLHCRTLKLYAPVKIIEMECRDMSLACGYGVCHILLLILFRRVVYALFDVVWIEPSPTGTSAIQNSSFELNTTTDYLTTSA